MKIYSGSGDRGKTSLFSGERVPKNHNRIEAYGDVDELNSVIGATIATLPEMQRDVIDELRHIQSDLFHLSSWLATTPGSPAEDILAEFSEEQVEFLENAIDRMADKLPTLKHFILPGGHISATWTHVARAVCRRAERHMPLILNESKESRSAGRSQRLLVYLNRLSDYFFVLARYLNNIMGVKEILWKK